MSSLTGQQINQSYQGLLKLTDSTTGITAGHQSITDGEGNDTGIRIGENFFQPPYGISHYELEPNDYYGTGVGASQVSVTGSQPNSTTIEWFYDRGIESYSAVTFNMWTQADANEELRYAFYKLGYLPNYGYVATEKVSPTYTFTGITLGAGFREHILDSPLSFSGTGPGLYAFAHVYYTPDGSFTGRFTAQAYLSTNFVTVLTPNLGFIRNSLDNAAPTWLQSNATTAVSNYILSGSSLPSSFISTNYPPTSFVSTQAGFLLNTIK
jgi:hypothetical protein